MRSDPTHLACNSCPSLWYTQRPSVRSYRTGPDTGDDIQICRLGVCLLITYVPLCPILTVSTPCEYSTSAPCNHDCNSTSAQPRLPRSSPPAQATRQSSARAPPQSPLPASTRSKAYVRVSLAADPPAHRCPPGTHRKPQPARPGSRPPVCETPLLASLRRVSREGRPQSGASRRVRERARGMGVGATHEEVLAWLWRLMTLRKERWIALACSVRSEALGVACDSGESQQRARRCTPHGADILTRTRDPEEM